jgi:hypothetical protein
VRQIASAILMCILLFNLVGYRFVADYMQQKSDAQLEARLDKDQYEESQLVELKIPINLPYQTSWSAYVRYDGEIQLDGISYKYVSRKLSNDTLYIKCIPNTNKMHLETAKDNFFKNNNDIAQNSGSKKSDNSKSIALKKLLSEYNEHFFLFSSSVFFSIQQTFGLKPVERVVTFAHISPEQPPDFLIA